MNIDNKNISGDKNTEDNNLCFEDHQKLCATRFLAFVGSRTGEDVGGYTPYNTSWRQLFQWFFDVPLASHVGDLYINAPRS